MFSDAFDFPDHPKAFATLGSPHKEGTANTAYSSLSDPVGQAAKASRAGFEASS